MRCLTFWLAVAVALACEGRAQHVPGRDLLRFPIGLGAEAAALGTGSGGGLWNPATIALGDSVLATIAVAGLEAPADMGVAAQLAAVRLRIAPRASLGVSFTRASVNGILRTETDPQSLGDEVPYHTLVSSFAAAVRRGRHFTGGLAIRYRTGRAGRVRGGQTALDGGVVWDRLGSQDGRIAISSYLWRPGQSSSDHVTTNLAADVRLFGTDRRHEARAGYGLQYTSGISREHYLFGSVREGYLEGRVGFLRTLAFEDANWRARLGLGLHYARYVVAIAREDSGIGLGPVYQFMLSTSIFGATPNGTADRRD